MSRFSNKDKVHFLEMSFGSLMEVMSQLEIAEEENYISKAEFQNTETLVSEAARLISGLQKSFVKPNNDNTEDSKS